MDTAPSTTTMSAVQGRNGRVWIVANGGSLFCGLLLVGVSHHRETSSPVDFYGGLLELGGKQVLTPTVQHGKEGDLCAEMFGVGGNLEQALGGGLEQQVVRRPFC